MSDPSGYDPPLQYGVEGGLAAAEPGAFPWPPPEHRSIITGLVDTWSAAVLRPVSFFRAMPSAARIGPALLYYLVIGILASAIDLFWNTLLPPRSAGGLGEVLAVTSAATPLVDFLLSPVMLLLSLLLSAGITQLLVLTLVPGHRGFGGTLRIFCYAYGPALFAVVPRIGPLVAFAWMTVLSVIGIREVHRTSTPRAVVAVLIPLLIAGLLVLFAFLLLRSGALLPMP